MCCCGPGGVNYSGALRSSPMLKGFSWHAFLTLFLFSVVWIGRFHCINFAFVHFCCTSVCEFACETEAIVCKYGPGLGSILAAHIEQAGRLSLAPRSLTPSTSILNATQIAPPMRAVSGVELRPAAQLCVGAPTKIVTNRPDQNLWSISNLYDHRFRIGRFFFLIPNLHYYFPFLEKGSAPGPRSYSHLRRTHPGGALSPTVGPCRPRHLVLPLCPRRWRWPALCRNSHLVVWENFILEIYYKLFGLCNSISLFSMVLFFFVRWSISNII